VREHVEASENWAAAVEVARLQARRVADAAAAVVAGSGDLAAGDAGAALDGALGDLESATTRRDIGAISARRDDVIEALAAFREAVAAAAEARAGEFPSADQPAKDELVGAVAAVRATDDLGVTEIGAVRRAADRVAVSHRANVAAAEAAAVAAAAAAAATAAASGGAAGTGSDGAAGPSGTPVPPSSPVAFPRFPTELTIDAYGDYWPGCPVEVFQWDWWYYDSSGYVLVDPGYPYDIEVMTFEGRIAGVKSLPCVLE
jgi:hypothetical protein